MFAEMARTLVIFALAAALAKPVLHRALAWVARHGTAEVFLLAALFLVVAAAFGAQILGLSPALGAFLAGVVLGESDFRHRMEDDIRPFRDLLLGLFFITFHRQQPAARIARVLHHEYPHLVVIATSLTDREASHLLAIPGLHVYPEKIAAGLALAEQALLEPGLSAETANSLIARLRLNLQSTTKVRKNS